MTGNMYDWVGVTWNPLAGWCSHECRYCYVASLRARSPVLKSKYSGTPRLDEKALNALKKVSRGSLVFVCSCTDLFAADVPSDIIERVIAVTRTVGSERNLRFLWQSKNPERFHDFQKRLPPLSMLATTIETDNAELAASVSKAPGIASRVAAMDARRWRECDFERIVTVEPALKFDVRALAGLLGTIEPHWVNIGVDSKGHGLMDPTAEEIENLALALTSKGIEVRLKGNVERVYKRDGMLSTLYTSGQARKPRGADA